MKKTRFPQLLAVLALLIACVPAVAGEDTVTFGVVYPMTGNNIMVGDFIRNGALLAQKHINERGGILGKKLELVFEDEVDNLQASVNAMTKMLNYPNVPAFFGSTYSSYCIAISPMVKEKEIIMFAGGSSANIPKERNDFVWQARMTDDFSGKLMANAAIDVLGLKNPAIIHIAESFGTGLMEQTVAALKEKGVTVNPSYIYAHVPDEKQFGPMLSQIANSDCDGLIAISHQMPASVIAMQVDASGLDIPFLGSSSFGSVVVRETAGEAADGWYSVCDWSPEASEGSMGEFARAYRAEYQGQPDSDMPAVACYDSIMLFAEGCRIAGTTTDAKAINEGLKKIKAFPGGMSIYTPNEDHCFCTSQFLTYNVDQRATVKEIVVAREP